MISTRLKALFLFSIFGAIAITLVGGWYTYEEAPPYFSQVLDEQGRVLATHAEIMAGQHAWQKYGLMNNGSVWGHGTYRGNDYTATSLNLMGRRRAGIPGRWFGFFVERDWRSGAARQRARGASG